MCLRCDVPSFNNLFTIGLLTKSVNWVIVIAVVSTLLLRVLKLALKKEGVAGE